MHDSFEIKLDSIHNNKNKENSQSKNDKIIINNSFLDLTLSDIENKDKNSIVLSQRSNSVYQQKEKEENEIDKMTSLDSIKLEDFNNIFSKKKYKSQLTKEDLNNIPLPIFSCIYCSNEKISFRHFINEKLSKKYLLLTLNYDIVELIKILFQKHLIDINIEKEDKIIKECEYMNRYYIYEESKKIINEMIMDYYSFEFKKKHFRSINHKLNEIKKSQKKLDKLLTKNINNNYYYFNENYMNNISINNLRNEIVEINYNKNKKKINENFKVNQIDSKLSISNINLINVSNNIDKDLPKEKDKKSNFNNIIERIEKSSNRDLYRNSLSKKIKSEVSNGKKNIIIYGHLQLLQFLQNANQNHQKKNT